jgi:O6-methylguanine-DNA--protein-cysteine methyltransferase
VRTDYNEHDSEDLQEVVSQLNDYFQEKEPVLIVNLSSRHRFPKKVWAALLDIPLEKQELI